MKILIINTLYAPLKVGGAEKSVQLLAEDLVNKNNDVSVLTLKPPETSSYGEIINGVKVIRVKLFNVYWPFSNNIHNVYLKLIWHLIDTFNLVMLFRVLRVIKQTSPNVVHTHNLQGFSVSAWLACKILRKKIIHTTRDYYLFCLNTMRYKNGKRCDKACISCSCLAYPKKLSSKLVDVDIGISEFILNKHLNSGFFSRGLKKGVVYNVASNTENEHKEFKVDSINNIGFIGRIHQSKGVEVFLKLALENSKYTFFLAGSGNSGYIESLKTKYANKNIHFLGHSEANCFYQKIDLLVVPSLWDEPFGRVVVEAIESKVPVLVTNYGGLSELVPRKYILDLENENFVNFDGHVEQILNEGYQVKSTVDSINKYNIYEAGDT